MDDKKRELLEGLKSYHRFCWEHGDLVQIPRILELISEAGYVLLPTDDPWYLYREGQRNQRAKDAAIAENFNVFGSWSPISITRNIAKAIRAQTDAE